MALADATDGRVAAHLPQGLDVVRQKEGAPAHTRSRKRGLGAGMAAADHDHVVFRTQPHLAESPRFSRGATLPPEGVVDSSRILRIIAAQAVIAEALNVQAA